MLSFIVDTRENTSMSVVIQVFDPALCCSTGICGPSVDPQLVRFAADLDWLQRSGVCVERFNLAQQPKSFAETAVVKLALEEKGESALPLILIDRAIKSAGLYPSREQLAEWAGVAQASTNSDDVTSKAPSKGCCGGTKASGSEFEKPKCC